MMRWTNKVINESFGEENKNKQSISNPVGNRNVLTRRARGKQSMNHAGEGKPVMCDTPLHSYVLE